MAGVFIACSMTDCKWNKDGQCNSREIFVDRGPMCATFEPEGLGMGPELGLGGPRESFRDLLVGGGGLGPPGPPMGGPPVDPMGGPPAGGGMMGGPPPVL